MLIRKPRGARRSGVAAVETAMVLLPALMMVFGVFEFGRMLMAWNLLNNAAREGCRWALVNSGDTNIANDVTAQVKYRMAGQDTLAFNSFGVTVSGTHNGVSTPVNNLTAGDLITVTVSGNYNFMNIIPFINFGSMTLTSAPTMVCEGAN